MPQTTEATFRERIAKLQDAMKEFGLQAVVLEPGPAMTYLTGVRWGKSERTFGRRTKAPTSESHNR
ncbi:Putative metal-dependent dipeptidase (fragment) [Candidatus Sulfopaludibacter sp. SbA3]